MIEIDWSRCRTTPRPHQREGVRWLVAPTDEARGRTIPNAYLLADAVGVGKSKQVVDSEHLLFEAGAIDTVVVVAPGSCRGVWADPDPALGEVAKHGWTSVRSHVVEYSVRHDRLRPPPAGHLHWIVTNYEFIRRPERLLPLARFLRGRAYSLVADESWALADHTTLQWEAVAALRHHGWIPVSRGRRDPTWKEIRACEPACRRVVLLNGTPVGDTPLDLFGQGRLLHSTLPGFKYFSHFRARYAVLRPNTNFPMITGWQNLEELRARFEPYVLRREIEQCEILDPVLIEARLGEKTWRIYCQMRDEMIAWLTTEDATIAKQAFVKSLRLAQITSGFIGGVERVDLDEGLLDFGTRLTEAERLAAVPPGLVQEIGREKLDALLAWLQQLRPQPDRVVVWSRFRPEIERTARVLAEEGERTTYKLYGAQSREDRQAAIRALNPDVAVDGPVAVVGHAAAGGAGLNFSGASLDVSLSHDPSLRIYTQKRGRIDRGVRRPIRYVDVVATGPRGQRTIDHHVLAGLRNKEDIAAWTAATWRRKLQEE